MVRVSTQGRCHRPARAGDSVILRSCGLGHFFFDRCTWPGWELVSQQPVDQPSRWTSANGGARPCTAMRLSAPDDALGATRNVQVRA
jgi:hypothetical protein